MIVLFLKQLLKQAVSISLQESIISEMQDLAWHLIV